MSRSPGTCLPKPDRPGFRGGLAAGLLALGLALSAGNAAAQGPDADWRTLSTGHFRVHYPVRSEAWARRAASRIESIWARVEEEVGYRPSTPVDVVVADPVAAPNGSAWPFLGWPRIVLWTSPPGPDSVIGHYRDWSDLLVVHEATHLVHLLRPSRNPFGRRLGALLPLGPVARKSPRWVTEGYATVVEGRLTGFGRPNGDLRAALLRRLAQAGQLPSYGELNNNRRWLGGSMAYLVGSAYLEWLDARSGPGTLPKLWARLSARHPRSFSDAFTGVYGEPPERLYGEFVAETTHKAIEARRLAATERAGELWQDLDWSTGAPALSPDGDRLAIVLTGRDRPAELVVWGTGPDEKAEADWEKQRREIAERDPEDVPAVRVKPLRRKPRFTLPERDGRAPAMPRWMPDGRSLLYVQFEPDGGDVLHPDLFQWYPESGKVLRRTRFADLRDPDPAPDGSWAVAVRNRNGWAQLVRVVLETGKVTELTPPSVEETHDRPRVSPDGSRIAWVRHRAGAWNLVVRDLATGAEREVAPAETAVDRCTLASAAWSGDGRTIFAVKGCGGFIDVWAFPADGGEPGVRVTREQGAAFAPAPTPDGQGLFYLALEADGLDLRKMALTDHPVETPADLASLAPVVRPAPPADVPAWEEAALDTGAVYRPCQELLPLLGGSATAAGSVLELGARSGDLIGQLDLLALGALGDPLRGGSLAATWRGSPLAYSLRLFSIREEVGFEQQGVELGTAWRKRYGSEQAELSGGALYRRIEPLRNGEAESGWVGFVHGGWRSSRGRGKWSWEPGIAGHLEQGDGWNRWGGRLDLGWSRGDERLKLSWRRDRLSEGAPESERILLGGSDSSLWPAAVRAGRIPVPALPAAWLTGDEYEGQRAELRTGILPVDLFWARHRIGEDASWLALAGLERTWAFGPFPLARLPALEARIGVARVIDEPFAEERLRNRIRGWLGLVWRP